MTKMISALALLVTVSFGPLTATADQAPKKEVVIGVSEVYVPGGFSTSTDAYVIVSGMFPNSCYKWARAEVATPKAMFHEVQSIATVSQAMCLMVMVPYSKEVNLGRLESGEHTLRFLNGDGTYFEKTLAVE